MMSSKQLIMSRSLKRKIVIEDECSSETSQGTAKKNAQYCTGTTLSYSEETEEDIKIVFESEEIVLESDEANSENEQLKLSTTEFKLDTSKRKNEFFKHSFLPTMRKRNNRYTRNDSKESNLPISDAELRLLHSGTALSDPGDIVQLTEYPVSKAEIECYHRILSGGSYRKLISRRVEQNLKDKYNQHELSVARQPLKLQYPSVISVIIENSNVPSDSEIEILSDSVRGNVSFDDDSSNSSSANMSRKSENSPKCSVINNSGNRLDVPLSSDKFSFNSLNSNYDSMLNATNFNLQRNVSHCSLLLDKNIQDITNFIDRIQETTATEDSGISSHFHTTSTDIAINNSILALSNSNSNYDSMLNATNFNLQRNVSDCSSLLDKNIQDVTNFIDRIQETTATEDSGISSHFHTTSTDIAINNSILALSNSNSKKNNVTYNLQPNSSVHLSVPVDEMHNDVINGTKTAATDNACNSSSDYCTNVTVNYWNEIAIPFDELQKALDTVNNISDSDKSSANEIVSVNNNAQYFRNTVVNSCVTNESTLTLTNLPSSRTTCFQNEINVPFEELRKAIDTIEKKFGNDFGSQNKIVSVESNVQHFINAGSEECVGLETIRSPSPLALKENSDDDYEDFEPYYYDTDIESNEGNSLVSSGRTSLISTEDIEGHEFVATENINLLSDKVGNNFPFYINDKDMEIEKSKYDGFAYDITDRETISCDLNESLTSNEKFFCNINSEKEAATEVAKTPPKDISSEKIDDLNLLEHEKLTDNSTPKETIETTNDSNGNKTDDINLLESQKPIENSISIETLEDAKSAENKMSQPFYGNRVSNRGTFLTQKPPIKPPPKPKISKKKTFEVNKNLNTNPADLHASIETPDINIDLSRLHSHGNRHKCLDSSRNRPHKSLGISSHSDLRLRSLKDQQITPRKSRYQVYAENNAVKQNTGLPYAPVPTTSPVLINNNMPVQGTVLNANIPPTHYVPRTVAHLNSLSVSNDYRTSQYDVNRFPCFPLAPLYAVQHPFQPYASPRIPTSIHPLPLQSYMHPRFLPQVHPPQLVFQTQLDARTQAGSFMFHNSFDSVSEIGCNNEYSSNYTPPTNTACSQSTTVMLPPNMPSDTPVPFTSSFANDISSKSFDKETEASEIQVPNRKFSSETSSNSDISSSPPIKTSVTHSDEISGKPKCLVPSHMKHYIGNKIFKTEDVRLLILEWNVDSIHHQNKEESPPIFCNLKKPSNSYECFENYYNTFFPLLMLETWKRVCTSFSRLSVTKPFSAEIMSYFMEKDHVIVECKTVYNADPDSHPEAGNIVIVNYGTKSNEHTVKIFGYLIKSKLRRFDPETDTEICKYYTDDTDTECYKLPVLTFEFIAAYDSEHIDKQIPVRIELLYALKYNLKQHDALLFVKNSPFEKYILRPNTEQLLRFSLNTKNSEEEISKCVEKVMETILSPHPIPVMTIIKTITDSDHLKIVPLLIQRIKNNCSNMKILVCVRTRGTIADIASKLTSQRDLKFIIVCKRCNISPKFRKFLFDDLVKKKIRHIKEIHVEKKELKEEIFKIKKEIILDSDVVISWARDIHNDIIAQAFSETKSIDNTCCIIDEAHSFTEPETLIPILYGISKLILIGNTDGKPKVLSKTASTYDFDKSYFHRAYDPVTSPD